MNKHTIKTTRRADAEGGVSLAQRRTWYTDQPLSSEALAARMEEIRTANETRIGNEKRRGNFQNPRPGTFKTLSDAYAHEVETTHVSWVTTPVDSALEQMGRVAANERLNDKARFEDFTSIKTGALQELEQRYDNELAEIEDTLTTLEAKSTRAFSNDMDAGKLNYLRETLQGKVAVKQLNEFTLMSLWEKALADKDMYTVAVLYDNGAALARASRDPLHRDAAMPTQYDDLMQRSDDALRTPEQRKARAGVLKWEATRWSVRRAYMQAQTRLGNARMVNSGGKAALADGNEVARREMMNHIRL